jgi:hypothetical protein
LSRAPDTADGSPVLELTVRTEFLRAKKSSIGYSADRSGTEPGFSQLWLDRVNGCYLKVAPFFRGPSGEYLRIQLTSDRLFVDDDNPPAMPITIIDDPGFLSDGEFWSSREDCPVFIHEFLHFLGFPDYYEEPAGYVTNALGAVVRRVERTDTYQPQPGETFHHLFDCRARGPELALMANAQLLMAHLFPKYSLETCGCVPWFPGQTGLAGGAAEVQVCSDQLASLAASGKLYGNCPATAIWSPTWNGQVVYPVRGFDLTAEQRDAVDRKTVYAAGDGRQKRYFWTINSPQKPYDATRAQNLMYPNEFRALTIPAACDSRVQDYFTCAANTDRMSTKVPGVSLYQKDSCVPPPASCANGSTDWITR